ncbi:hypothetical protein [Kribbella sp. NBC_00359]|uniref:hypothetical protein n=1 Tax=Kribbella sp. NBC_00359 TaxID=2975966 RepID=UPI002E238821
MQQPELVAPFNDDPGTSPVTINSRGRKRAEMTPIFIASLYTAVENTRILAHSALPDAPVIADETLRPRSRAHTRARIGAVLRSTARRALKLADPIDPHYDPQTG